MGEPPTHPQQQAGERGERRWLLVLVRYVLPTVVVLAGIIVMFMGSETDVEGGGGIVSAGVAIFLANLLIRAGHSGEEEREAEERAREYFDLHGRWPD